MKTVGITDFVKRQTRTSLEVGFTGTRLTMRQLELMQATCEDAFNSPHARGLITEGSSPWVKIIKIYPPHPDVPGDFDDVMCPIVEVADTNRHLLVSGYKARRPTELAVLSRWFDASEKLVGLKPHHIDVVLYTNEQLAAEGNESGRHDNSGADFDIVSVNAELEVAAPMTPMTLMRNALGKEYGGSGEPIEPNEYKRAVDFWSEHAMCIS